MGAVADTECSAIVSKSAPGATVRHTLSCVILSIGVVGTPEHTCLRLVLCVSPGISGTLSHTCFG